MITHGDLCAIFQSTLANSPEERGQAQSHISNLAQTDHNFLNNLLSCIEQASQLYQIPMANYILKYTQALIKSSKDLGPLVEAMRLLIMGLESPKISKKSKAFIKGALTSIMAKDKTQSLYKMAVEDLQKRLSADNITSQRYEFLGNYIHICLCKEAQTLPPLMSKLYGTLLDFSSKILEEIKTTPLQNHQIVSKLNTLKIFLYALRSILSYTSFFIGRQDKITLLYHQSLNGLIFNCLALRCRDEKLIYLKIDDFDSCITTIKGIVANIFHSCLKVLITTSESCRSVNQIYRKKEVYLEEFLNCMQQLLAEKKYHVKQLNDDAINDIVTLVTQCGNIPEMAPYYDAHKQGVVQNLIFPILELRNDNQQLYSSEPEQFFNSMVYLVNRGMVTRNNEQVMDCEQTQFTLGVKAIKLIHYFCRYIDGMSTLFVNDCLIGLQKQDNHTALIILNSLVQKVQNRLDLVERIKMYICQQMAKYQSYKEIHEKISFYLKLLLVYRYISLIAKADKGFTNEVWQLVLKLLETTTDDTLKFLCVELIISTIHEGFSTLYQQRSHTINILISWIALSKNQQKFSSPLLSRVLDCLEQILEQSPELSLMQVQIVNCIRQIVNRLKCFYQKGVTKDSVLVNKCWNIIKTVIYTASKQKTIVEAVEPVVIPLYKYLKLPGIDEEDFMYVIRFFISAAGVVNKQYQLHFFSLVPTFFERNKNKFHDLFECINTYLYYGAEALGNNPAHIENIITMTLKSIDNNEQQQAQNQVCEGVFILQNLIYNCQQSLKEEHWTSIIQTVLKRLNLYVKHSFLKANLIVVLALSLVACFNQLQNSQIGTIILQQTLNISYFTERLPAKMLIVSFADILKRVNSPLVAEHYQQIFDSAITLTRVSHYNNEKGESSEEEEEGQFINDEIKQYKILVKRFSTPMMNLDQFECMKQFLFYLKENYASLFSQVVKGLPEEKKIFLKTVMQIEKVDERDHRQIIKVRRS